jgi:hypothetical protein
LIPARRPTWPVADRGPAYSISTSSYFTSAAAELAGPGVWHLGLQLTGVSPGGALSLPKPPLTPVPDRARS